MSEHDQTISFLPTRLNREATVFGGMTVSEFGISASLGFALGLIVGLFFWILTDFWLLIPAMAMLLCIATVLVGKVVVAAIKRGKPEAYLNRLIEKKLDDLLNGNKFIRREGFWSIRRYKRM
ncbi:TIGR03750 family conjugal transfer protein [Mannheimia haemolytica]|uniref:Conjugative transfer region protein n=1 Tax=Mannheimia haemolytica TaxID=75985 RepID=A0A378NBX9_MANHA|nr:TIGR03750 family conjugal transfer protein [Mannheimia haemolytica]TCS83670.1 conjugative transfer region protein (TIGR03750 family) [Mannheimia haemolytica]UQX71305.1 TIGR03750 family conjugal transfer protein [Mannheimia haemolytica]STY52259.1 conjugative transfer region protein [Mannheimia haemolytica]STY65357.1 conjugative transfer region protein [Mannheimia haemolytica]